MRTRRQDIWANAIEQAGQQSGVQFKFGEGPETDRAMFANIAALIAGIEEGKLSQRELLAIGIGTAIIGLVQRLQRERR